MGQFRLASRDPYRAILFDPILIEPLYVIGVKDPNWNDAADYWASVETSLEPYKDSATAIIFEPIVQSSAGMKIYSQDFLTRLGKWAKANNIHLIADEIMTGVGRTGKMIACEHATIKPDFVCLAKGLTSGWVPFSAILTTQKIYEIFYNDYEPGKSFLHSHTYSGNAIGASLALKTLEIIENDQLCARANILQPIMQGYMEEVAQETRLLKNVRSIGALTAADFITQHSNKRISHTLYQKAVQLGALLRPLGNTIYWVPPLTVAEHTLQELKDITAQAIYSTLV